MTSNFTWANCHDKRLNLTANGDVSGPGVLVGFCGTGWVMVILVIGYYLLGFDPASQFKDVHGGSAPLANLDSDMLDDGEGSKSLRPNPIDEIVLSLVHGLCSRYLPWLSGFLGFFIPISLCRGKVLKGLERCVLAMCDAQIITGVGIMISGYILVGKGTLSAYHWRIIIYLAWFSNLTHQAGLVFLRGYFRDNPRQRTWRVLLMTVLTIMLMTGLAPTAFFNWDAAANECSAAYPAAPAKCFYSLTASTLRLEACNSYPYYPDSYLSKLPCHEIDCAGQSLKDTRGLQSAVVSSLVIMLGFSIRIVKLFEVLSFFVQNRVRRALAGLTRRMVANVLQWELPCRWMGGKLWSLIVLRPVLALYIFGRMLLDFYSSAFSDICWLLMSAVIGTIRLLDATGLDGEGERQWTFGQILSVLLLAAPLLMMTEATFSDTQEKHRGTSGPVLCDRCTSEVISEIQGESSAVTIVQTSRYSNNPAQNQRQRHFYTTDHLDFQEEINRLFKRDYYNEYVWVVFSIFNLAWLPVILFVELVIFLIIGGSVSEMVIYFVYQCLSLPGIAYASILTGLLIEGWKFEYYVGFFMMLGTCASAVVPCVFLANYLADERDEKRVIADAVAEPRMSYIYFMSTIFICGYGPTIAYFLVCPFGILTLCVWDRMKKRHRTNRSRGEIESQVQPYELRGPNTARHAIVN